MKHYRTMLAGLLLTGLTVSVAPAQDTGYEPADAEALQQCHEAVTAGLDDGGQDTAAYQQCIGVASDACQQEGPDSQTTMGMANCAARETAWWDEQLNSYYDALRDSLTADQFAALRTAQRNWLAYRDAACDFEYEYWKEGTIRSIFYTSCIMDKTAKRAIELGGYLDWTQM